MRAGTLVLVALWSGSALAEPTHELSAAAVQIEYLSSTARTNQPFGLELSYDHSLLALDRVPLRIGAVVRVAPTPGVGLPLEAAVRASMSAGFGIWEATVGPEVGYSALTRLRDFYAFPDNPFFESQQRRLSSVYVALNSAPLRLRFGRFWASAFELQLGTPVAPFGSALRVQLGFLRVGGSL